MPGVFSVVRVSKSYGEVGNMPGGHDRRYSKVVLNGSAEFPSYRGEFGRFFTQQQRIYWAGTCFLPVPARFRTFSLKASSSDGTQNSSPMTVRSTGSCNLKTCGFALTHGAV